jgi:O-antigen/teichoic acid export membrane protein
VSVTRNAFTGVAWVAVANWLQLGLSATTFAFVVARLAPADIGLYGVAALAVGLAATLFGGPLNESLEQRADLSRDHVHATFWVGFLLACASAAGLIALAQPVARLLGAPGASLLIAWMAAALPLGGVNNLMRALMIRDQRFREVSQYSTLARIVSSLAAIVAVSLGAQVWALLVGDLVVGLVEFVFLAFASRFRPGPPRRLGAIRDLVKFNLHTLATYGLSYADTAIPRAIASSVLGPQALGYLIIAGRVLDQVTQIVLSPLGAVTMTSVARLQSDPVGLRKLILGLYHLASLVAYPAFLGAIAIMPALAALAGEKWIPAVPVAQIMLLVGLRTATGAFNFGILRGLGRTLAPVLLLAVGVALQLVLVPIGVRFGATGVAWAMLIRIYATWPIACWLVQRTTGVGIREQLTTGTPALIASAAMAGCVWAALQTLANHPPLAKLGMAVAVGAVVYPLALAVVSPRARQIFVAAASSLIQRRQSNIIKGLRAEFGL